MEKPIIFVGENDDDMNYPIGIQRGDACSILRF